MDSVTIFCDRETQFELKARAKKTEEKIAALEARCEALERENAALSAQEWEPITPSDVSSGLRFSGRSVDVDATAIEFRSRGFGRVK